MARVCTSCGVENPDVAKFCMSCGTGLANTCPACGTENPEAAKFCMSCGTQLASGAPGPAPATPAGAAAAPPRPASLPPTAEIPEGLPEERRRVTVLFADLSGYTSVAEQMDPEAVKAMVERFLRRLAQEVERFGGTVDKYIGDNVMALFGAPVAHEDDEERAVRAALAMQEAMAELNEGLAEGKEFALRIGINSGDVLAGAVGRDYTVTGDTVNVAARLQAAARPGGITVGERTWRATDAVVEYSELEPLRLKGKAEPVPAWEVVGLRESLPAPRRAAAVAEAPLIGREEELDLLESIYARVVRDGKPHLATIIGEAGAGKSRMLRELEARLAERDDAPTVRQGRCLPYGSGVVYWALGEILRAECGITEGDDSNVAWQKVTSRLQQLKAGAAIPNDRTASAVARLLGFEGTRASSAAHEVPAQRNESAAALDPAEVQRMRDSFFSAVRQVIEGMAERGPLMLVFEDIHWADNGMLDLIEHLAQWVRGPVVFLCLARDDLLERRSGWGEGRRAATRVYLEPLTRDQTRMLVQSLLPADVTGANTIQLVADRAGGNPLFAEEIARHLAEEGPGAEASLPDNVQALLAARLDSLDPFERRLVQQAAVVGRTFIQAPLERLAQAEGRDLAQALETLAEKDIVVPAEGPGLLGEPELAFKHVLIRDVAYGMLPKAVRARKHHEIGDLLAERVGDRIEEFAPLLAEHFRRAAALGEEAGLAADELEPIHQQALRFLEAAGDAASALYSNPEALRHYQAARDIRGLHDPATTARISEKEGDVALRMGRVDTALEAWEICLDHHRGEEHLERVGDLHRKIGAAHWNKGDRKQAIEHYQKGINLLKDGPPCIELVRLYEEAAWLYMHTGDNILAIYASERALRLAERLGETRAASRAHGIFGRVFGRIGDAVKARDNLEKAVELARGSDESEAIRALLALGYHLESSDADYAAAAKAYEEGLAVAQRVGDLPAQVELHAALGQLAVHRADWGAAEESVEASARLAEREGLVGKLCLPYTLQGVLRWRSGELEESEKRLRRARDLGEQVGWSEAVFGSLLALALVLRERDDHGGALTVLDQALDVCERAGLVSQSIEGYAARAATLYHAGRHEQAREPAEEARSLAERLGHPAGKAYALEADGLTTADTGQAVALLDEARQAWDQLGRPFDAARCMLSRGLRELDRDPAAGEATLKTAAAEFERLDVRHMADRARGALAA